jgi:hypothetical protein
MGGVMEAEGYILTYREPAHRQGRRIGAVLYATEAAAKSARTNMFAGYNSADSALPKKERKAAKRARAEAAADIVPVYRGGR